MRPGSKKRICPGVCLLTEDDPRSRWPSRETRDKRQPKADGGRPASSRAQPPGNGLPASLLEGKQTVRGMETFNVASLRQGRLGACVVQPRNGKEPTTYYVAAAADAPSLFYQPRSLHSRSSVLFASFLSRFGVYLCKQPTACDRYIQRLPHGPHRPGETNVQDHGRQNGPVPVRSCRVWYVTSSRKRVL